MDIEHRKGFIGMGLETTEITFGIDVVNVVVITDIFLILLVLSVLDVQVVLHLEVPIAERASSWLDVAAGRQIDTRVRLLTPTGFLAAGFAVHRLRSHALAITNTHSINVI